MAFARQAAECPFCGSEQFRVRLFVNDMPMTDSPSELLKSLRVVCRKCDKEVFEVEKTRGGEVSATGVSVCETCEQTLRLAAGGWREEDIPKATYPNGTARCPTCGSELRPCWWRGWNYHI